MDIIDVPGSVDVQAFQFKRQRCVKVFDGAFPNLPTSLNLVAAASRLGVLFVGSPNSSLHVFQVRSLLSEDGPEARRRVFPLAACPVNLSLNCTQDLLCIVTNHNNSLVATIYLSKSCASENLSVFKDIRLSPSTGIQLCGLLWNPCVADILAVCTSDGTLSVYQCKQTSLDVQAKLANARCLSWSPKGKQIVTGNADGSLSQYKPDLTLVKNIPPPQLFGPNHIEAISIHWISNYQFGIVYKDAQNPDNRPSVTIVNTPKAGAPNCFNYEDICYSMGVARPIQYYLCHFPAWGILLALSANSMEIGVLGTRDQVNWQQWIQMDDARAELPLTESKQENYPIGFSYDDAAIHQLSWGENETLPHMPMVHVLSHTGTLVTFFAINFAKDSLLLCSPPQELAIPEHWMILDAQPKVEAQQATPIVLPEPPANPQQDISFAMPQNVATSTPTIPKSSSPFSQAGSKQLPVANLFGSGEEQDLQQVVKPLTDSGHHQGSGEVKPQQNASSKVSSFLPKPAPQAQPEKPFSGFAKPSSFFKQPPPAQPDKVLEIQPVQPVPSQASKAIKAHQDEEQAKSYETLLNQASNETIKALLLKEINEFQMELYDLLKRCKSINTTVGTASEMKEIIAVIDQYDREPPESIWSKEDVTHQITALKQSLIKMCSVLVKAQMQPETLELEQLAVLDPVSSAKLSAMKQNIYYIESQLKQVNNVLDDQWDSFQGECKKRITAFRGLNDGDSMKLPTLDKVYQPLVRQHDILARQESTVRTLQKLAESVKPQMLSSQIGRSLTKAYKDSYPLSALTKNLLNMSLQPIDILDAKHKAICEREAKHTSKKQNALRELLVNHHTVRIKPTKVEQSNRLQSFFDRNSLSSFESEPKKEIKKVSVNNVPKEPVKSAAPETGASKLSTLNSKMMEAILRPTPQFSDSQPLINLNKFVSNIPENAKPSYSAVPVSAATSKPTSADKNINKSPLVTALLQNKTPQESAKPESVKANVTAVIGPSPPADVPTSVVNNQKTSTFMGQPICSPTPRSTGSIFGTATSPQVPFGSPTGNSVFSLPKPITSSSASNATSSESSAFKSFAPPPVSKETSIFSTPKPQTTTPISQGGVRKEVQSPTQETENSGSSFTFGSLTISKVPSTSTPISVSTSSPATFTGSISSVFGTPPTTGSIFSSSSVSAISKPSAAPTVTSPAPPPSFALSNTILTSSNAADPLFSQSSPSTTPLPFGTQSTSIFGSTGSSSATSIFGGTSASTTTAPAVTVPVSPPSVDTVAKPTADTSVVTTTLATTTPISSPPAASSIFGAVSSSPPPVSVFIQPASPQSVFGGTGTTPGSVFGASVTSTTTSSMFGGTVTSPPGFGSAPQAQPSAANTLFASANANIAPGGSMFDALSVSPTSSTSSIFGTATTDTNASSLFGAANAAVPSTISSLFGNASISTTNVPFGSPPNTGGSVFGGGAGFGSPSAFGQSGGSVFGGGGSAFGQPQTNAFGGGTAFGGFGGATSPPASSIFGQAPAQSGSMFGSPASPVSQGNLFGGGSIQQGQSMFGTPAATASPQQGGSIFGSPTGQSSVFGGAATFGSKPVFGQTNSFGGSPTGSGGFGAFSGTGDQQNVASAGFGSPSAFSKPPGTFGGSPSFGSPTGFGTSSTFAPSFSSPVKSFGPPGTDSAFGSSQSSTFENLATQSTIGFGNLAQQSPPAQTAAPAFQGNPSFSMWR